MRARGRGRDLLLLGLAALARAAAVALLRRGERARVCGDLLLPALLDGRAAGLGLAALALSLGGGGGAHIPVIGTRPGALRRGVLESDACPPTRRSAPTPSCRHGVARSPRGCVSRGC